MFKRILVPLDGSTRAERALPVAARIAHATGGALTLVYATSFQAEYAPYLANAPIYTIENEIARAKEYLDGAIKRHHLTNLHVFKEALPGVVAQTILNVAHDSHADLIVICSHGYTGFKRWALGSVARKVVRQSSAPVLVLYEHGQQFTGSDPSQNHPLSGIIALDGSAFAEASISPTAHLLSSLTPPQSQARIHLVQVLKSPILQDNLVYQDYSLDLNLQAEALADAKSYMQSVADTFTKTLGAQLDMQVTWEVKESQDVAGELLQVTPSSDNHAKAEEYDLMTMATHGRDGFNRWIMGSVTENVLDASRLPLFIVRPQAMQLPVAEDSKSKEAQTV